MNKITPEVIFDRFTLRLRERADDLEYIVYAPGGFEKWAQWELYLSFKDDLLPVIYTDEWEELKTYNDFVAEIKLEYNIGKKKRVDFYIAEEPNLAAYVNPDSWQIKGTTTEKKLIKEYVNIPSHYIELKTGWWNLKKNCPVKAFVDDIESLNKLSKNYKSTGLYKPRSYIAAGIFTFYDQGKRGVKSKAEKIEKQLENFRDNELKDGFKENYLYSCIVDTTYLVMTYKYPSDLT